MQLPQGWKITETSVDGEVLTVRLPESAGNGEIMFHDAGVTILSKNVVFLSSKALYKLVEIQEANVRVSSRIANFGRF